MAAAVGSVDVLQCDDECEAKAPDEGVPYAAVPALPHLSACVVNPCSKKACRWCRHVDLLALPCYYAVLLAVTLAAARSR